MDLVIFLSPSLCFTESTCCPSAVRAYDRFCGDGTRRKDGTHQDRIFWVHHDPDTGRSFLVVYAQLAPYNGAKWDMNLWATYCDGVRFVLLLLSFWVIPLTSFSLLNCLSRQPPEVHHPVS